jgi:hypothetical protein
LRYRIIVTAPTSGTDHQTFTVAVNEHRALMSRSITSRARSEKGSSTVIYSTRRIVTTADNNARRNVPQTSLVDADGRVLKG